ncbi:hypothetical protein EI94DRAFT_1834593 [Lactarius quietus]|nr:hypothetical protein EI94DRAFT_1834593 [Lactarius quietus]
MSTQVKDGINDLPVLTAVTVGIALSSGTSVAIKAADIILVHSDLLDIIAALNLSCSSFNTICRNLIWCHDCQDYPKAHKWVGKDPEYDEEDQVRALVWAAGTDEEDYLEGGEALRIAQLCWPLYYRTYEGHVKMSRDSPGSCRAEAAAIRPSRAVTTLTITSLTVHHLIISAAYLSPKSHCDAFCANAHYVRVGGLAPVTLARLERAFLANIDWRLACTREVLHCSTSTSSHTQAAGFYILSSSSSSSASSTNTDPSTHTTDTNDLSSSVSSTGDTPSSNPGTSPDETMFDSPEDGASSVAPMAVAQGWVRYPRHHDLRRHSAAG